MNSSPLCLRCEQRKGLENPVRLINSGLLAEHTANFKAQIMTRYLSAIQQGGIYVSNSIYAYPCDAIFLCAGSNCLVVPFRSERQRIFTDKLGVRIRLGSSNILCDNRPSAPKEMDTRRSSHVQYIQNHGNQTDVPLTFPKVFS